MSLGEACKSALTNENDARANLARFWNLVYSVAVAFTLLTIGLVAALVWGNSPSKYLTGIAAIASGGGLAWVVRMKNVAQQNLDAAHKAVRTDCKISAERGIAPSDYVGLPDEAIEILTS